MSLSILICDDSSFARKQMARALPEEWEVDISFAKNGQEAINVIQTTNADILFLDLNMPVMDGFQTLQEIRRLDLNTLVIVVSADIQ
ncbi:MAG: response regulator, partial [Pseudomonadota bacterium]